MTKNEITYMWAMTDNGLVHISNTTENKFRCPSCHGKMVARRGQNIRHHFAHWPGDSCGGPETVAHLLGKEVILRNKELLLPLTKKTIHAKYYEVPSQVISYSNPVAEKWVEGFIPDILAEYKLKPFIIEIKVTHKTDYPKHSWIAKNNILAIEIDCKNILQITPEELDNFILFKAPRKMLFSPDLAELIKQDLLKKQDLSLIKKDRAIELKKQAEDIIALWKSEPNIIPLLSTIEKNNLINIGNGKGTPFKINNTYLSAFLNTYKNIDIVLDILQKRNYIKYTLNDDIKKILYKFTKKDFSSKHHLKMLYKIINKE